jgi:hypothetical protein
MTQSAKVDLCHLAAVRLCFSYRSVRYLAIADRVGAAGFSLARRLTFGSSVPISTDAKVR